MNKGGSCSGQLTLMDFVKTKPVKSIMYQCKPVAYLVYGEGDRERVDAFKRSFVDINFVDECNGQEEIDYVLLFISKKNLKNEKFLERFLDSYQYKNGEKIVGLIIDDEIYHQKNRMKLYKYYNKSFKRANQLIQSGTTNDDIRHIVGVYERSRQKVGDFLNEILHAEKVGCAEARFEEMLRRDTGKGHRIRMGSEKENKWMQENATTNVNYNYNYINNNCNIGENNNGNSGEVNSYGDYNIINSGVGKDELECLCDAVTSNIGALNEENQKRVKDMLVEVQTMYRDERKSPKDRLGKCLANVAAMFTIINGVPNAVEQLQQLQTFLMTHL